MTLNVPGRAGSTPNSCKHCQEESEKNSGRQDKPTWTHKVDYKCFADFIMQKVTERNVLFKGALQLREIMSTPKLVLDLVSVLDNCLIPNRIIGTRLKFTYLISPAK